MSTEEVAELMADRDEAGDEKRDVFEVWKEHGPALQLFLQARRCWLYAGMGGTPYAFDVGAAERVWAMKGKKVSPKLFDMVDAIASGALEEMAVMAEEKRTERRTGA